MTLYQWLTVLGVQALSTGLIGIVIGIVNKKILDSQNKKTEKASDTVAIKKALQLIIRSDLLKMYERAIVNQCVTQDEHLLFLDLYDVYEDLYENGVMTQIHDEYIKIRVVG